jgi:hypothetical protein
LLSTNHKCTQPCYFPPATVVGQDPLTGIDRQHESQEARSLYLLAL